MIDGATQLGTWTQEVETERLSPAHAKCLWYSNRTSNSLGKWVYFYLDTIFKSAALKSMFPLLWVVLDVFFRETGE